METPHKSCDDAADLRVSLPGPGFIANLVTEATGCGGVDSPWRVEAQPGQTVRLSLLDFTLLPPSRRRCLDPGLATTTRRPGGLDAAPCPALAVVREPVAPDGSAGGWHNVTVTARRRPTGTTGTSRENLVYVSQGHVVEVAILTSDTATDVPYFMVKYEGERRRHAVFLSAPRPTCACMCPRSIATSRHTNILSFRGTLFIVRAGTVFMRDTCGCASVRLWLRHAKWSDRCTSSRQKCCLTVPLSSRCMLKFKSRTRKCRDLFGRNCAVRGFFFANTAPHCNLIVNGQTIEKVNSCKCLGIIIDDELKWNLHIENIYKN